MISASSVTQSKYVHQKHGERPRELGCMSKNHAWRNWGPHHAALGDCFGTSPMLKHHVQSCCLYLHSTLFVEQFTSLLREADPHFHQCTKCQHDTPLTQIKKIRRKRWILRAAKYTIWRAQEQNLSLKARRPQRCEQNLPSETS